MKNPIVKAYCPQCGSHHLQMVPKVSGQIHPQESVGWVSHIGTLAGISLTGLVLISIGMIGAAYYINSLASYSVLAIGGAIMLALITWVDGGYGKRSVHLQCEECGWAQFFPLKGR